MDEVDEKQDGGDQTKSYLLAAFNRGDGVFTYYTGCIGKTGKHRSEPAK